LTGRRSTTGSKPSTQPPPKRAAGLCTRWVIILILEGRTNPYIRAALARDDLPCPIDAELDGLRAEHLARGFKPKSPKNTPLLQKLGVAPFFPRTPEAEEALVLLREPRVREIVEAGVIVGVPVPAIVQTLRVYLKRKVSPAAIDLFRSVFFDVSAVMRAQLRVLVHARVRLAVMRAVADPEDEVAAGRAVAADARSVAVSLPSSFLGWASVLMAAGYAPGRRDLAEVIGHMESVAVVRASEAMLRGEPEDERRAEAFVGIVQRLHQIRGSVVTPESEIVKKLNAFRVQTTTETLPTIAELRAGGDDVTIDVAPPLADSDAVDVCGTEVG
jgi:hypothetical protein